ncbi:hypothetical protein C8Q80DRAFT_1209529 [Daedaleopsis nitida]|nr:hypothetical protein C8Q80DRAFT_1209529 [Daedaleopsis nitida]
MLPAEIRLQIFDNLKDNPRTQLAVLHVCRAWRWQLFHTPEFWVSVLERKHNLVGNKEIALFRLYLTLTASHPISLNLLDLASPAMQFEILSPHCHRITSLTVNISSSTEESLNIILKYGMAHLEHLDISHHVNFYVDFGHASDLALDRASLPRLKSLVHPFRSWIETALDERLRHLSLFECRCRSCFRRSRTEDFSCMALLRRCTSLEMLALRGVLCVLPTTPHTIILPPVGTLHILDQLLTTTRENIIQLSYPSTCCISLYHHPTRAAVRPAFPKEFVSSYPHISEIDEVHLMFPVVDLIPGRAPNTLWEQANAYVVKAHTRRAERLHICMPSTELGGFSHTMELLRAFAAGATLTTLAIDIPAKRYTEAEARNVLSMVSAEFPDLRRLDVGRWDARQHVLPFLSMPKTYAAPAGGPLCPQLQSLAIVWRQTDDGMFRYSSERHRERSKLTLQAQSAHVKIEVEIGFEVLCVQIARLLELRQSTGAPLRKVSVRVVEMPTAAVRPGWELQHIEEKLQEKFGGLLSDGIELSRLVET